MKFIASIACSFLLLFCVTGVVGCAPATPPGMVRSTPSLAFASKDLNTVAVVVETTGTGRRDANIAGRVETEFLHCLNAKGYQPRATQSELSEIQRELKFQQSGWTDRNGADIGRMLNVSAVLMVRVLDCPVYKYQPMLRSSENEVRWKASPAVSARLIDSETAGVLWNGDYQGSLEIHDRDFTVDAIAKASNFIANTFSAQRSSAATQPYYGPPLTGAPN